MASRTYLTKIEGEGSSTMTGIPVPFDPKEAFGSVRAPVVVTIGKHSFRSTIFRMSGCCWVPLRKTNRDAAGVDVGDRVRVTLTLDEKPRTVTVPRDLAKALKAASLSAAFKCMSFTHQREHVEAIEQAKKPETRARRIESCLAMVREKASTARTRKKA